MRLVGGWPTRSNELYPGFPVAINVLRHCYRRQVRCETIAQAISILDAEQRTHHRRLIRRVRNCMVTAHEMAL
jgi:hypothetical protein